MRELGQRGYPADVRERVSTTEIGRVVAQEPDAGTKLDRGEQVAILVARGRATVQVPKVVGLPVAKAFERLQAKGLRGRAEPVTTIAGTQAPGIVVRQSPASFDRAPRGSTVALGVSAYSAGVTSRDATNFRRTSTNRGYAVHAKSWTFSCR